MSLHNIYVVKDYSQPGFCTSPYPFCTSFFGNALRYHIGENPPGFHHARLRLVVARLNGTHLYVPSFLFL